LGEILITYFIMKRILLLALLSVAIAYWAVAKEYKVSSPDNKISVTINVGPDIKWSATYEGKEVIYNSKIAMMLLNGGVLGENEKVKKAAQNGFKTSFKEDILFREEDGSKNYTRITNFIQL
jgi:alpha-glucosidase